MISAVTRRNRGKREEILLVVRGDRKCARIIVQIGGESKREISFEFKSNLQKKILARTKVSFRNGKEKNPIRRSRKVRKTTEKMQKL